jgi:hypothetical protein
MFEYTVLKDIRKKILFDLSSGRYTALNITKRVGDVTQSALGMLSPILPSLVRSFLTVLHASGYRDPSADINASEKHNVPSSGLHPHLQVYTVSKPRRTIQSASPP